MENVINDSSSYSYPFEYRTRKYVETLNFNQKYIYDKYLFCLKELDNIVSKLDDISKINFNNDNLLIVYLISEYFVDNIIEGKEFNNLFTKMNEEVYRIKSIIRYLKENNIYRSRVTEDMIDDLLYGYLDEDDIFKIKLVFSKRYNKCNNVIEFSKYKDRIEDNDSNNTHGKLILFKSKKAIDNNIKKR